MRTCNKVASYTECTHATTITYKNLHISIQQHYLFYTHIKSAWWVRDKEGNAIRVKDDGTGNNRHWSKIILVNNIGRICNNMCDMLHGHVSKKPLEVYTFSCTFTKYKEESQACQIIIIEDESNHHGSEQERKVHADGNNHYSDKELNRGYMPSGLNSRLFTVVRQTGRQTSVKNFKIMKRDF